MRTKRKAGESMKGRPKKLVKKFKKQTDYDSGSGDDSDRDNEEEGQDFTAVNLADSDEEQAVPEKLSTHVAADSDNDYGDSEPAECTRTRDYHSGACWPLATGPPQLTHVGNLGSNISVEIHEQ